MKTVEHPAGVDEQSTFRTVKGMETYSDPRTRLAGAIVSLLSERGMSRRSLAKAAQIGRSTLYECLTGAHWPNPGVLRDIASALDTTPTKLLTLSGVPPRTTLAGLRMDQGWSRNHLSRLSGVSLSVISRLEAGGYTRPDVARKLACTLGVAVTDLGVVPPQPATNASLPALLRRALSDNGYTAGRLAARLGVSRQLVSSWVHGSQRPAPHWLPALHRFVEGGALPGADSDDNPAPSTSGQGKRPE